MASTDGSTAASPRSICSFSTAAESLDGSSDAGNSETPQSAEGNGSPSDGRLSADEACIQEDTCGCCDVGVSSRFFMRSRPGKYRAKEFPEGGKNNYQTWACGCAHSQPQVLRSVEADETREREQVTADSTESEQVADATFTRTKLEKHTPSFQPRTKDTRVEAVANAANLVLASCGHVQNIAVE